MEEQVRTKMFQPGFKPFDKMYNLLKFGSKSLQTTVK